VERVYIATTYRVHKRRLLALLAPYDDRGIQRQLYLVVRSDHLYGFRAGWIDPLVLVATHSRGRQSAVASQRHPRLRRTWLHSRVHICVTRGRGERHVRRLRTHLDRHDAMVDQRVTCDAPWCGVVASEQDKERGTRARNTELAASRGAAVIAEDHSLRRLKRDIHDGPQQRIIRLQYEISSAERKLEVDPEGARELLAGALQQSKDTLDELRSLSRGFAPRSFRTEV
jgi:signal transduction histidine kinase